MAGVSEHNGWAVVVSVTAQNGAPAVIDRRRAELIEPGLPNQPYEHDTLGLGVAEAEDLVREVRESAAHCAERALSQLRSSLGSFGELVSIALREAPLAQLPRSVAAARASYPVLARADGMLYHRALCTAAGSLGIGVAMFARGDEGSLAAKAAGTTAERLDRFLSGLRANLGPPWQLDHRAAAARAIAALAGYTKIGLPGAAGLADGKQTPSRLQRRAGRG